MGAVIRSFFLRSGLREAERRFASGARAVVLATLWLLAAGGGPVANAQTAAAPAAPTAAAALPDPAASSAAVAAAVPGPATTQRLAGPPAGFVAPALPQPDETTAERATTQPGNNAPFWRAVRGSGEDQGTVNLPGAEKGTLIQPFTRYPGSRLTTAGEAWRQVRNDWIIPYGGALLIVTIVALAILYFTKGPVGGPHADTGRRIERFTPFERAAHWVNAFAFVVLAVSGIVMAFGKFFLLPVLGATLFGWLTYALKTVHNLVGPLFVVSLLVVIVTFIRDNFPQAGDWAWIRRGGGLFGGHEPPSHRFNAGEKLIFWGGVLVLGLIVVGSGLVLDQIVPGIENTRRQMQIAHIVHGTATAFMMAAFIGHIYMGTIGMRGALSAMRGGYVDEGWAAEHHALWYADVKAGRIPAQRSGHELPAGTTVVPPVRPLAS
jgi:formate dehydrogenase subunit gamma